MKCQERAYLEKEKADHGGLGWEWELAAGRVYRITPVTDKSNGKKNSNVIEHLKTKYNKWLAQFSSVAQSCPTLCDPMDCSMPGLPVHCQLPELAQTHVHQVGDAIQPSHPLSSPSLPAFNLPQHQGLFKWISSSNQVARVLEFQLQHQSFQWIFRTDFL